MSPCSRKTRNGGKVTSRKDPRRRTLSVIPACVRVKLPGQTRSSSTVYLQRRACTRVSNGCPGSNRRTHLLPTAVGHSVIYGPVLAAEQGVEDLLAAKEEGGVFREVADDWLFYSYVRRERADGMAEGKGERERKRDGDGERKWQTNGRREPTKLVRRV